MVLHVHILWSLVIWKQNEAAKNLLLFTQSNHLIFPYGCITKLQMRKCNLGKPNSSCSWLGGGVKLQSCNFLSSGWELLQLWLNIRWAKNESYFSNIPMLNNLWVWSHHNMSVCCAEFPASWTKLGISIISYLHLHPLICGTAVIYLFSLTRCNCFLF